MKFPQPARFRLLHRLAAAKAAARRVVTPALLAAGAIALTGTPAKAAITADWTFDSFRGPNTDGTGGTALTTAYPFAEGTKPAQNTPFEDVSGNRHHGGFLSAAAQTPVITYNTPTGTAGLDFTGLTIGTNNSPATVNEAVNRRTTGNGANFNYGATNTPNQPPLAASGASGTLEMLVNFQTTRTPQEAVISGSAWWVRAHPGTTSSTGLRVLVGTASGYFNTTAVNDNNWHHVAIVVDRTVSPNQLRTYVDGSQVTKIGGVVGANFVNINAVTGDIGGGTNDIVFGNINTDNFQGMMDRVVMIDQVLAPGTFVIPEKKILSFNYGTSVGVINEANHTIALEVPSGTNLAALAPTITQSPMATVSPAGAQDFTNSATTPVTYTVTAMDQSTQTYAVTVTQAVVLSPDCDMTALGLTVNGNTYSGTINGTDVTLQVPWDCRNLLSGLTPSYTVSGAATVTPTDPQDFTNSASTPVDYTVHAQDGIHTKIYHVRVNVTPVSTDCDMLGFSTDIGGKTYSAAISGTKVTLGVPSGTVVSALVPTVTVSQFATVAPASGIAQDFSTSAVSYLVTAQDGVASKTYSVNVVVGPVIFPPDLNQGAQYRLVFVTSGTIGGQPANNGPTDISGYNGFATTAATSVSALNSLGAAWNAVVSFRTSGGVATDANTNTLTRTTDPSVPIYNLAGVLVASGNADLWNASIGNPINRNELGALVANGTVIQTGAQPDGGNRQRQLGYPQQGGTAVSAGNVGLLTGGWIDTGSSVISGVTPMYAMSNILTMPDINSPACDITSFTWNGYTGVIDEIADPKTIVLHIPSVTSPNMLDPNPTFVTSLLATCNHHSGGTGEYDFSTPQTYTVTAANGVDTKSYQATVIADVPGVTLGISGSSISEDGGTATVTATLSNISSQDVTVNLAFSGTAVLGTQYTRDASSIPILAGQTEGSITLTGVQDNVFGLETTVVVGIGSVTNGLVGTPNSVTANITNTTLQPAGLPQPAGINPGTGVAWANGDKYQLVFVTSTTSGYADPNIAPYNAFVNAAAAGSSLPGIPHIAWKAMASALNASATPAKVNAPVSQPVYLVDGTTLVAAGYADMWDGSIANPINLDESGGAVAAGTRAWTGSYANGTSYKPLGKADGWIQYGLASSTDGGWFSADEQLRGVARLYALSVPLTYTGGTLAGYALWASNNNASSDPTVDSNNNGIPNGVEYFTGATALNPATIPALVTTEAGLTWTWPRDPLAAATYEFQVSETLNGDWRAAVAPGEIVDDSNPDQVKITLAPPGPGESKKFCRLVVTVMP